MSSKQYMISAGLAGLTAWAVVTLHAAETGASEEAARASVSPRSASPPGRTWTPRLRSTTPDAEDEREGESATEVPHPQPPDAIEAERPDREEAAAREIEIHEALLAESRAEPRDAAWAGPMEAELRETLAALQEPAKAVLGEVECRSSTCEATVTWANHGDAIAHGPELVSGIVHRRCSKRITFTADQDQSPYDATLYFDCDQS